MFFKVKKCSNQFQKRLNKVKSKVFYSYHISKEETRLQKLKDEDEENVRMNEKREQQVYQLRRLVSEIKHKLGNLPDMREDLNRVEIEMMRSPEIEKILRSDRDDQMREIERRRKEIENERTKKKNLILKRSMSESETRSVIIRNRSEKENSLKTVIPEVDHQMMRQSFFDPLLGVKLENYLVERKLGQGTYGHVYLVLDKCTNFKYCIYCFLFLTFLFFNQN